MNKTESGQARFPQLPKVMLKGINWAFMLKIPAVSSISDRHT